MAFTYATLSQTIQDYVESQETSFVANIPTIIKQTEERILKSVQLPVFIKNSIGNTTTGSPYLNVPSDYLTPYSIAIDNSGYEFLLLKSSNYIREAYPDSTATGAPKVYAQFDVDNLILGPTPDANYQTELHYFYRPQSITESGDGTSWLGTNAENALLYGCLLEAYTYLKGDADLMQLYASRYAEAMEKLENFGEGYATTDNYRYGQVRKPRS
jgi:hypothetical protein